MADPAGDVLKEMNFARQNPQAYANVIADFCLAAHTVKGFKAGSEAIQYLNKQKPLPPLAPCPSLVLSAKTHVTDQSVTGNTGHIGADRSNPRQRMSRYGRVVGYGGENIAYGYGGARTIVARLIIDEGVNDRGHRKNFFSPYFHLAGVAIGKHLRFRTMCVIDFAEEFYPKDGQEKVPLYR
jgi:uncharacterized protein YkwD